MWPVIRRFEGRDVAAVVELSLRAWAPVFASLEQVLGSAVFRRLHPDWREDQQRAVEEVCASPGTRVWVVEVDGETVGFVATGVFDPERSLGEISMLGVDPDYQARRQPTASTTRITLITTMSKNVVAAFRSTLLRDVTICAFYIEWDCTGCSRGPLGGCRSHSADMHDLWTTRQVCVRLISKKAI